MSKPVVAPINLFQARPPLDPSSFFLDLSALCEREGVTKQDVYGDFDCSADSSFLRGFEAEVASYLYKDDALFLPSGVMAANIVLSIVAARTTNKRFLCHFSSHILLHEHNAWQELLGLEAIVIPPKEDDASQSPVSYESFLTALSQATDSLPGVVVLECPHRELGGKATSFEDIECISQFCRDHGIHFHMDGARLWEAQAVYDLDRLCPLFDTIYVSTYKGLGGLTGALLAGKSDFVQEGRVWLRRFGGNLYSQLPCLLSAWRGFHENRHLFVERRSLLVNIINEVSLALKQEQLEESALIRFDPAVPLVALVHVYLNTDDLVLAMEAVNRVLDQSGIHVLARLRPGRYGAKNQLYTEFNLGPANASYDVKLWVRGYILLQRELRRQLAESIGQSCPHVVQATETFEAPVERIWAIFRAFKDIGQIVGACSELEVDAGNDGSSVGSVRVIRTGAATIKEKLLHLEDEHHLMTYEMTESDLPLVNYIATIQLHAVDERSCRCEWWSDFTVQEKQQPLPSPVSDVLVKTVREEVVYGLYQSVFANIRSIIQT
eukprot:gene4878-5346_t